MRRLAHGSAFRTVQSGGLRLRQRGKKTAETAAAPGGTRRAPTNSMALAAAIADARMSAASVRRTAATRHGTTKAPGPRNRSALAMLSVAHATRAGMRMVSALERSVVTGTQNGGVRRRGTAAMRTGLVATSARTAKLGTAGTGMPTDATRAQRAARSGLNAASVAQGLRLRPQGAWAAMASQREVRLQTCFRASRFAKA